MMQMSLLQSVFLDMGSSSEHLLGSAKIDIRGSEIFQGLMVALVVVIVHKTGNLSFQLSGQKISIPSHKQQETFSFTVRLVIGKTKR